MTNKNNRTNAYKIKNWVFHPEYFESPPTLKQKYDISLVELDRKFNFEKQNHYRITNGICLPDPSVNRSTEDEYALIGGWGAIDDNKLPQKIQMGWVKVFKEFHNSTDLFGQYYAFVPLENQTRGCAVSIFV